MLGLRLACHLGDRVLIFVPLECSQGCPAQDVSNYDSGRDQGGGID